jgi:hypothetical protein
MSVNNDIPMLTEGYEKSHRSLMLSCGLLLAWELIGVEIGDRPLSDYNIVLKSPEAVPLVLLILVLYFMFKITIEWHQCHVDRRSKVPSKIDYYFSVFLAVMALGIYFYQQLLNTQIVEIFGSNIGIDIILILISLNSSFFAVYFLYCFVNSGELLCNQMLKYVLNGAAYPFIFIVSMYYYEKAFITYGYTLFVYIFGIILTIVYLLFWHKKFKVWWNSL